MSSLMSDCETLLGLLHQLTLFSAKTNDSAFTHMQPLSFEMPRMWNQVLLVNRQFIRLLCFRLCWPVYRIRLVFSLVFV